MAAALFLRFGPRHLLLLGPLGFWQLWSGPWWRCRYSDAVRRSCNATVYGEIYIYTTLFAAKATAWYKL